MLEITNLDQLRVINKTESSIHLKTRAKNSYVKRIRRFETINRVPNLLSDKGSRKKRVQKRYLKKIKIETVNAMLSSVSDGEICESSNPQASTTNKKPQITQ